MSTDSSPSGEEACRRQAAQHAANSTTLWQISGACRPFQDARTLVKVGDGSDNARVNPLNTQMARRHVKRSGREDEADLWIGVDLGMTYTGIAWRCLTGELKSNDST